MSESSSWRRRSLRIESLVGLDPLVVGKGAVGMAAVLVLGTLEDMVRRVRV